MVNVGERNTVQQQEAEEVSIVFLLEHPESPLLEFLSPQDLVPLLSLPTSNTTIHRAAETRLERIIRHPATLPESLEPLLRVALFRERVLARLLEPPPTSQQRRLLAQQRHQINAWLASRNKELATVEQRRRQVARKHHHDCSGDEDDADFVDDDDDDEEETLNVSERSLWVRLDRASSRWVF